MNLVTPKAIDRTGTKCGKLTAIRPYSKAPNGEFLWSYQCDCGGHKVMYPNAAAITGHCGCLTPHRMRMRFLKHGMSATPVYKVWAAMRARCQNPNNSAYQYYGGRGITVCPEWEDFEVFIADMGPRPPRATVERLNNELGYSPTNCAWKSRTVQQRNRRGNRVILGKCIAEWSEVTGLPFSTISGRLRRGWSEEDSINTPINTKYKNHNAKS